MNINNSSTINRTLTNQKIKNLNKQTLTSFKGLENKSAKEPKEDPHWRRYTGTVMGVTGGLISSILIMKDYLVETHVKEWGKFPFIVAAGYAIAFGLAGRVIGGLYDLNALAEEQLKNKSNTKTDVAKKS